MNNQIILFITQASQKVGLGHLSRCITLAKELEKHEKFQSTFLINNSIAACQKLEKNGFQYYSWKEQSSEVIQSVLNNICERNEIYKMIVDLKESCLFEEFNFLPKQKTPFVLIDNWPRENFAGSDSVIPSVILADKDPNEVPSNIIWGENYLILNEDITSYRMNKIKQTAKITVLSGGGGTPPVDLIKPLANLPDYLEVEFIIGPYTKKSPIKHLIQQTGINNFSILRDPHDYFHRIQTAEIILTPFGISAYECIALGTCTMIYTISNPLDKIIVEYLDSRNTCVNKLNYMNNPDKFASSMIDFLDHPNKLTMIRKLGKQFINGSGAKNVVQHILGLS